MPALKAITVYKLVRIVGTPNASIVIDLGQDTVQHTIPAVLRRPVSSMPDWSGAFAGRSVIVVCEDGGAKSQGAAAWLRQAGVDADHLEGGSHAWSKAGPLSSTKLRFRPAMRLGGRYGLRARGPRSIGSPVPG